MSHAGPDLLELNVLSLEAVSPVLVSLHEFLLHLVDSLLVFLALVGQGYMVLFVVLYCAVELLLLLSETHL